MCHGVFHFTSVAIYVQVDDDFIRADFAVDAAPVAWTSVKPNLADRYFSGTCHTQGLGFL